MKVEPTGVVMLGLCSIRTKKCTASKKVDAITAVWTLPSRTQIDVCRSCLDEQLRDGVWEAEGVRVPGMKYKADIVVFDAKHNIALVAEVKATTKETENWIISNSDRLSGHVRSGKCKYFMYITPVYSYLIDIKPTLHNSPETEWKCKTYKLLEKYIDLKFGSPKCLHDTSWLDNKSDTEELHKLLQDAAVKWLVDVASEKIKPEILSEDLILQIKDGEVKSEVVLQ